MIPPPTAAQKQALFEDRDRHRIWLGRNKIEEPAWPLSEDPYTGLLLASLLDPDASSTVCTGLLAGANVASMRLIGPLTGVQWPTQGVDLIVRFGRGADTAMLFVEHKRFRSHSHAPGYKNNNGEAPWQTDQVFVAIAQNEPPSWLAGESTTCQPKTFLVLDAYGKEMEQLFPEGQYNNQWDVTSYPQFGSVLRIAYEKGVRGLVPLLSALYAGCLWSRVPTRKL
jgi:hypothetical protein